MALPLVAGPHGIYSSPTFIEPGGCEAGALVDLLMFLTFRLKQLRANDLSRRRLASTNRGH